MPSKKSWSKTETSVCLAESHGKNSNDAPSFDPINQKKHNLRAEGKVTLMYEPRFDAPSALLAFIQHCHLSSRCVSCSFTKIPLGNINYEKLQRADASVNPTKAGFPSFNPPPPPPG